MDMEERDHAIHKSFFDTALYYFFPDYILCYVKIKTSFFLESKTFKRIPCWPF